MDSPAGGAVGAAKGALGGLWSIVSKYIVPIAAAIAGYAVGASFGFGSYIDTAISGVGGAIGTVWKGGYGDLIIGAVELAIGLALVTRDGIIVRGAGGFIVGMGVGTLLAGAKTVGVMKTA